MFAIGECFVFARDMLRLGDKYVDCAKFQPIITNLGFIEQTKWENVGADELALYSYVDFSGAANRWRASSYHNIVVMSILVF